MINISVVAPHFNNPKKLRRMLDSIPDDDDIEIIVVDDQSTIQGYDEVAKDESYKKVQFLKNNTGKKGAGVARNVGLNKASGKWVTFIDDDDYFTEMAFSSYRKYLASDADIVFFKPTSIFEDTRELADRHIQYARMVDQYLTNPEKYLNEIKVKYYSACIKLFKRKLIVDHDVKFSETMASNDVLFSLKMALKAKRIEVSPDTTYVITRRSNSLTSNRTTERIFDDRVKVFIEIKKILRENGLESLMGNGATYVTWSRKFGIKKMFQTLSLLHRNGIYPLNIFLYSPRKFISKALKINNKYRKNKKYFKK